MVVFFSLFGSLQFSLRRSGPSSPRRPRRVRVRAALERGAERAARSQLHHRHRLQRRTRGRAALLPRDVSAANRAHVFKSHYLRSDVFVVEALDAVVEVVHFHLFHFALSGGLFATAGSWQARAERGCTCDGRFWPAVVLGQTWPWDRGGLALGRSSVTGHQGVLEGTVDIYRIGRQRRLQSGKVMCHELPAVDQLRAVHLQREHKHRCRCCVVAAAKRRGRQGRAGALNTPATPVPHFSMMCWMQEKVSNKRTKKPTPPT